MSTLLFVSFFVCLVIAQDDCNSWVSSTVGTPNGNGSKLNPFQNLTAALVQAKENDTICVYGGSYREHLLTYTAGNVTVLGLGRPEIYVTSSGLSGYQFIQNWKHVTIIGFDTSIRSLSFTDVLFNQSSTRFNSNLDTLVIKNCTFIGGGLHLVHVSAKVTISNSTFTNMDGPLWLSSAKVIMKSVTISNFSGSALFSVSQFVTFTVTFYDCNFRYNNLTDPEAEYLFVDPSSYNFNHCTFECNLMNGLVLPPSQPWQLADSQHLNCPVVCPKGKIKNSASTKWFYCSTCSHGTVPVNETTCDRCPPGTYIPYLSDQCLNCTGNSIPGYFGDDCDFCSEGTFAINSTFCGSCPLYYVWTNTTRCTLCTNDTYSSNGTFCDRSCDDMLFSTVSSCPFWTSRATIAIAIFGTAAFLWLVAIVAIVIYETRTRHLGSGLSVLRLKERIQSFE
eukprot:TRINITY_DN224_c0_g1_i1.p1 TRINITY_DN224_c0_g1~~TRINITY_DN224_c0_g1_i1.p1  ORF type:complete len:449 (+),score=36.49 TRINITY_DN224_c0_g1_i1:180-1526(+)